jgi:hypothetical protein
MKRRYRWAAALAIALAAGQGASARAQYGYYPHGYGGYGWGGWGGGGTSLAGSTARGMGAFAAGAGVYNEQTAQARSMNVNTAMRYNQYMYESHLEATKQHDALLAKQKGQTLEAYSQYHERIRNNPDSHDIEMGDALNAAVEEIENPRVNPSSLKGTRVKISGEMIRDIPFRFAPAGICTSIHQLTQNPPPAALMTSDFDEDRAAFKGLGTELKKDIAAGEQPDPETLKKAIAIINTAEAKADNILPRNTKDRNDVDRYLKSLHGLLVMLQTPALDALLAGADKHPDATLGDLLSFMSAYNLRFGQATTPRQKMVYNALYPKLDELRDEVGPALAGAAPAPKTDGSEVGEFFSGMSYDDLRKKAPHPNAGAPR